MVQNSNCYFPPTRNDNSERRFNSFHQSKGYDSETFNQKDESGDDLAFLESDKVKYKQSSEKKLMENGGTLHENLSRYFWRVMKKILFGIYCLGVLLMVMTLLEFIYLDKKLTRAIERQLQINSEFSLVIKDQAKAQRLLQMDNQIIMNIITSQEYCEMEEEK